jgi:peptidoglycan hydrolase-like protein with peptidoglycan-binding domain
VVFRPGPLEVGDLLVAAGSVLDLGSPVLVPRAGGDGTVGDDVLALEEALARLGFDAGGTLVVDGVFDHVTTAAVTAWQAAVGAEEDGIVDLGEVVFLPGAVRISDRLIEPGGSTARGTPVLATSTDESVVAVDLAAADQSLLDEGDAVVVVLPDDTEVPGRVSFKATTATISAQGEATFEVIIVPDDLAAAEGLDQAPVDVEVVTDSRPGAVAVPVTALLALAEGGYAVEAGLADGTTRLLGVEPGMYADGLVEIVSGDIRPGDLVVAP